MNVVSFSGGKDSTAMLLMMLERGVRVDRIVYVDTTKEFPQMYEHIEQVKAMIAPLKIETVKIDFDYWFSEYIRTKGKRIGVKGYWFPDFRIRWCTALKRDAIKRYQKTLPEKAVEFHGIAFDERERTLKNAGRDIRYPLVEWEVTEAQALKYCYDRGLDWGGLYEKLHRVSCWCCPMSRIGNLRVLFNDFPDLWRQLEEMDKKSIRDFRSDYTVKALRDKFEAEKG